MGTPQINLKAYKLYKDHLVHYLKPTSVALRLPAILKPEEKSDIMQLEQAGKSRQATERLLDILDRSDHEGKWTSFLYALKDYPRLIKILTSEPGEEVESQEYHVKWIHIFAADLQEVVSPGDIVTHLQSKDVINEEDVQEILHKVGSSGKQAAFPLLLGSLPRRHEPRVWFPAFLRCLIDTGHRDLVHEIDPEFLYAQTGPVDMTETQGSSWIDASCNAGNSEEIEMVMEDSGGPDIPTCDMAVPFPSNPLYDLNVVNKRRKLAPDDSDGRPCTDNLTASIDSKRRKLAPDDSNGRPCTENLADSCYPSNNSLGGIKGDLLQNMNIIQGKKVDVEKDLKMDLQNESLECNMSNVAVIPGDTLRKKHNVLLVKLNENIYPEDQWYQNFLTYLRDAYLPAGLLSAIEKEPRKVFELMEQRGILKVGDYRVLEEALKMSSNLKLLDHVRELGSKITRGTEASGGPCISTGDFAAPLPSSPGGVNGDVLHNMNILDEMKCLDMETNLTKDLKTMPFKPNRSTEDEAADSNQLESENELASNYESSDEDKNESKQEEHSNPLLNLRNYQLELAEDALRGKNTIICAETGSGKTWVALYIVKKHLESASSGKKLVVFIARTNPLIKQQHQRFEKYLPNFTTKLITGDSEHSTALNIFLPDCDIICFTPQILVNNLEKQTVSLSDFSLMILDECHHTRKDDAYNWLMRKYLMSKLKINAQNLPQIIGLTATFGVDKSTSDEEAVDHIISVMANLDVCKLSTVEKNREEIEKYISRPKEDKIYMKDKSDDLCKKRILEAMIDVQKKLQDACLFEASLVDIVQSKRPRDINSQQYTQWARNVERIAASEVENTETSRLIISCVKYLVTFNEALELNSLLGISDVGIFLAKKFNPEKEHQNKHTTGEKELFQIISKVQSDLGKYNSNEDRKNPNLETLSTLLQKMLLSKKADQESRALVFVNARVTCTSLAEYLENILCKGNIHVHKLTGKAAIPGDEGMTEAEQTETLNKFASGEYRVLVSTSVGSEGIDIPDCNIVISYNYAGNEITKIQMTGRARKLGGKNIVIGDEKTLNVDKLNTIKTAMMYRAMESVKKIEQTSMQRRIRLFQQEEIRKQEFRDRVIEKHISMKKKVQFKLLCLKCSVEVTDDEGLRVLKDSYHVVIDKKFKTFIDTKPHKKPSGKKIEGLQKADKIYCKKCGMDWGVYFMYNSIPLPTIKCESFKFRGTEDGKISPYKKWLNVPFKIETCELSDISDLLGE